MGAERGREQASEAGTEGESERKREGRQGGTEGERERERKETELAQHEVLGPQGGLLVPEICRKTGTICHMVVLCLHKVNTPRLHYTYDYVHVHIYIYVYIHIHTYMYACIHTNIHIYTCMLIFLYVFIHLYIYTFIYIFINQYFLHIDMFTHAHMSAVLATSAPGYRQCCVLLCRSCSFEATRTI